MNEVTIAIMDLSVQNRQEVYKVVASKIGEILSEDSIPIEKLLYDRELKGGIEIAEGVVLPHCEENFRNHCLVVARVKPSIEKWSNTVSKVELILALAIATNKEKGMIKSLMIKLADDDFIKQLKEKTEKELLEVLYGY